MPKSTFTLSHSSQNIQLYNYASSILPINKFTKDKKKMTKNQSSSYDIILHHKYNVLSTTMYIYTK